MTVKQSRLDTGKTGFATDGTAETPIKGGFGVLGKWSQRG